MAPSTQKPKRASLRLVEKSLKSKANSSRKMKRVSSLLSKGRVWNAVRSLYVPKNHNVSSRFGVSSYFHPVQNRYNASSNSIHRNNRATKKALETAILNKTIMNMTLPITGKGSQGAGISKNYVTNAIKNANMRYALIGRNRKLKAFALLKVPSQNTRYINVISGFPSYGSALMNKILNNARKNGKKYVTLKAVTNAENNTKANNYPLVKWYRSKGFVRNGTLSNSLLPMRYTVV